MVLFAATSPVISLLRGEQLIYHLPMKVRDILRLLEDDGWYLARTKGSHKQFKHPSKPGTVTIAGKSNIDLPTGTLSSILKQAGLKKGNMK
jgi:predicted RNA binding protein YcfA (HicA-like mRNA interferase family)